MASVYHTKIIFTNIIATTAQTSYGVMNLLVEAIGMPWRSTTTGANSVTFSFASSVAAALMLHDVNFAAGTYETSVDGTSFAAPIAFTTYADEYGRRRALIEQAATAYKALRVNIASGTPVDLPVSAWWNIGAAYLMATKVALPKGPKPGLSGQMNHPGARTDLSNGIKTVAGTGVRFDEFSFDLQRTNSRDFSPLLARMRGSTIIISFDQRRSPWLVMPVINVEAADKYRRDAIARGTITLQLREKVN